MVIVNTTVLVLGDLGRSQSDAALMLAAYGGGSMLVALTMPTLLEAIPDRRVMLTGGIALPVLLLTTAGILAWTDGTAQWALLLGAWAPMRAATSTILTPSARLLRRNSGEENRPAVFAAQFSLSHACFVITYPLAGVLGGAIGLPSVSPVLVAIGAAGAIIAAIVWHCTPVTRASESS